MEQAENGLDEEIGSLVLSVKAVMLLCGNSVECKNALRERINTMQDEEINSFIDIFQKPPRGIVPQISIAIGEVILASILLFVGVGILTPALIGFQGPDAFLHYFVSTQIALINAFPYFPFVILTDFIIAIALLSAAFYALRESADLFADAGLRYR
ncbi:hypothetical protein IX51_02870 [uncultured archaeon]|nr:hypothetical protein IX51_02870 [uncultured archaeon]